MLSLKPARQKASFEFPHAGYIEVKAKTGLKSIALFEAGKGLLVLLTALAAFRYIHSDWQLMAEHVVAHFHMDPARRYPRILLALSKDMTEPRLLALAFGALFYVALRWVEAYGLWFGKNWAAMLGIISAGLYLPFEIIELVYRPSILAALVLSSNIVIIYVLWRSQRRGVKA